MLAGHPSEDILGVRGAEKATYEQVVTGGMRSEYVWLNGAWACVQKSVDAVLPGRVNLLSGKFTKVAQFDKDIADIAIAQPR